MSPDIKIQPIRFLPLLILAALANILSQATHETGHHLAYEVMGRDPVWGFTKLVQIWETPPIDPEEWVKTRGTEGEPGWLKLSSQAASQTENAANAAAGPLAGLFGAVLGLVAAQRSRRNAWKHVGLAYSLSGSIAAVLYYLRSPIRTGGDENTVAALFGLPKVVVEIPLALGFIICFVLALRMLPSWRSRLMWSGTVLAGSIASAVPMVVADPIIIEQVNKGSPWFQPILGYSLPVIITIGLSLFGIWLWIHWQENSPALP